MSSRYAGRSTRRYKRLRKIFRAHCAMKQAPCWLDGKPIDYSLPAGHPESFSIDHAIPVTERVDLAEDPANFRPSHLDCNVRRGTDDPHIALGKPSEHW